MWPRLQGWFANLPYTDPIEREYAYVLQWFLIVMLGSAVVGISFSLAATSLVSLLASGVLAVSSAAVVSIGLLLLRQGRFKPAVTITAISITCVLALSMVPTGLAGSRAVFALFTLPIVVAGLLVERRTMWATTLLSVLLVGVVAVVEQSTLAAPIPGYEPLLTCLSFALCTTTMSLFIDRFGSSLRRALYAAQNREQEARRAERALRESEDYYRLIADNTNDLIALLDLEGQYLYTSPSFTRALGRAPVSLIGTSALRNVYPDDRALTQAAWQRVLTHGTAQGSYRTTRADGSWCWAEISFSRATQHDEQYVVVVARDITERRSLEAQLQQAQKMEAMGLLAGSVAHDFNNLLVVIGGCSELAIAALPDQHPVRSDILEVQQASQRASALTRQLLAFARRQVIAPQVVQVGDIVLDIVRLLQRLLSDDIQIITRIAPDLWLVRVDAGQIEQVLMNMAVNAHDAMPNGGTFTIALANTLVSANLVATPTPPGEYVQLSISDTGIGMSEELQQRIFEPFFTTKAPDKGTGLGLATCYGIVAQSGGTLTVTSAPGAGTTFTIRLPRSEALAVPEPQATTPPQGHNNTATVLVVEDDPHVRALALRVAREQHYQVLEAENAEKALAIARVYTGTIDLLVTDLVLPHMNGAALAVELAQHFPSVRVLLTSGYNEYVSRIQEQLAEGIAFLPKPWTPAALSAKMREVLDRA